VISQQQNLKSPKVSSSSINFHPFSVAKDLQIGPPRRHALAAEQIRSVSSKGGFSASSMDTKAKSRKRATWI
jgi:hypothetical protein